MDPSLAGSLIVVFIVILITVLSAKKTPSRDKDPNENPFQ